MQVHGTHRKPERLYWNAAGDFVGTLAPPCTRKPKTKAKAEQLALFGSGPGEGPAKRKDGEG